MSLIAGERSGLGTPRTRALTTEGAICGLDKSVTTTPVVTRNAKTKEDTTAVNINSLYDLETNSWHARQCRMYRLFQPTFIPRQRLQKAIGCISVSFYWIGSTRGGTWIPVDKVYSKRIRTPVQRFQEKSTDIS